MKVVPMTSSRFVQKKTNCLMPLILVYEVLLAVVFIDIFVCMKFCDS